MKWKLLNGIAIAAIVTVAIINVNLNKETNKINSLLKLVDVEALATPEFIISSNGHVGIFNVAPCVALEVGSINDMQQVKINGNLIMSSDGRLKENIKDISNSLDRIKQLRSVSYNFKGRTADLKISEALLQNKDTAEIVAIKEELAKTPSVSKDLYNRNIYGFLAEELQDVLPDLVYEDDSTGMLAVDYLGLIPLLVDAMKEQQKQIEKLQRPAVSLKSPQAIEVTDIQSTTETEATLYQSAPNSFKEKTAIRYALPANTQSAEIHIFNVRGDLLKKIPAEKSGYIEIKGSDLKAGMYSYSLIVDGEQVDTKQLLLTK